MREIAGALGAGSLEGGSVPVDDLGSNRALLNRQFKLSMIGLLPEGQDADCASAKRGWPSSPPSPGPRDGQVDFP